MRSPINTLTKMQRTWFERYMAMDKPNATEAARGIYAHPEKAGPKLLANPRIRAAIDEAFHALTLTRQQVLVRISEQATADHASYIRKNGTVNLKKLLKDRKGHLIKSIKPGRFGLIIEFHDAQEALFHLSAMYQRADRKNESPLDTAVSAALDHLSAQWDIHL